MIGLAAPGDGSGSISAHAEEPAVLHALQTRVSGGSISRTRRSPGRSKTFPSCRGSISAHAEVANKRCNIDKKGPSPRREEPAPSSGSPGVGGSPRTRRSRSDAAGRALERGSISAHAEGAAVVAVAIGRWRRSAPRTRRSLRRVPALTFRRGPSPRPEEPGRRSRIRAAGRVHLRARRGIRVDSVHERWIPSPRHVEEPVSAARTGGSISARRSHAASIASARDDRSISRTRHRSHAAATSRKRVHLRARGRKLSSGDAPPSADPSPRTRGSRFLRLFSASSVIHLRARGERPRIASRRLIASGPSPRTEEPAAAAVQRERRGVHLRARGGSHADDRGTSGGTTVQRSASRGSPQRGVAALMSSGPSPRARAAAAGRTGRTLIRSISRTRRASAVDG